MGHKRPGRRAKQERIRRAQLRARAKEEERRRLDRITVHTVPWWKRYDAISPGRLVAWADGGGL